MRVAFLSIAVVCALASSGCLFPHLTVSPEVYRKQTFALVSFHGQEAIPTPVGFAGSFAQNEWGRTIVARASSEVRSTLESTLGSEPLIPFGRVTSAKGYDQLSLARFADHKASLGDLRPLATRSGDDPKLGALARELGADAVVAIANTWLMLADGDNKQFARVTMEIVIVGSDGKRLWDQVIVEDSVRAERTWEQRGAEVLGVAIESTALELTGEALSRCLSRFESDYRKGRVAR